MQWEFKSPEEQKIIVLPYNTKRGSNNIFLGFHLFFAFSSLLTFFTRSLGGLKI